MKIMIVTDAWEPQVNGVVRTLKKTKEHMQNEGYQIKMVTPKGAKTLPCPTYSEIQLTVSPFKRVSEAFEDFQPDCIHVSTEGPLGWSARKFCQIQGLNFTTSFHTRFAEYLHARTRMPIRWTYGVLRKFHSVSRCTMVTTPSMEERLKSFGFSNLKRWTRGVDTDQFRPHIRQCDSRVPRLMYVGRVAIEKNLEAFLDLRIPSQKVIVGDGPQLPELMRKYPHVIFTGKKFGEELAKLYSSADVFVFPSKTDTFGLVMLEALACGTPVAAYPTEGPLDVIQSPQVGCLNENLELAVSGALGLSREKCREYSMGFSWAQAVNQFSQNLVSI